MPQAAEPTAREVAPRHRSSAVPLAWIYAGLVVYASLYPFTGWRLPGRPLLAFVTSTWWPWWTTFDVVANLLGYLPLGALVFGAVVRSGRDPVRAGFIGVFSGLLLSLSLETLQNLLPQRVASNVDLGLNALGAALGVGLGALVQWRGGVDRWQAARDRWFIPRSAGGLALLLLWPVGLLFPTSVPFGLGQVLGRARESLAAWLQGTAAQGWAEGWSAAPLLPPLGAAGELSLLVLGLLAPCLVAFSIATRGWRRLVLVVGIVLVGCLATTLSTALNFGPDNALAWVTNQALDAIALSTALAALLSLLPRKVAAGVGLMALTALAMLVARAPADAYYAQSLQAWEQGRFIRFHGAAQWVGWAWPYVALAYLLSRLGAPRERRGQRQNEAARP